MHLLNVLLLNIVYVLNVRCISSQNAEFILYSACAAGGVDDHRRSQYEEKRFLSFTKWCNAHSSCVIALIIILYFATEKGKEPKADVECSEWQYGKCVPNSGDCGAGIREATCNEQTKKTKCKVPCNWKKDFGGKKFYMSGYEWNINTFRQAIQSSLFFVLSWLQVQVWSLGRMWHYYGNQKQVWDIEEGAVQRRMPDHH